MFHLPLPGSGLTLVLAPRFSALHWTLQLLLPALLIAAALGLVLWLYRREARIIRPPFAVGLLALRSALVILVGVMIAYQPVLSGTLTEKLPGRVLVAIDRSDSMATADPQRTPLEKLKLSRALHLGGIEPEKLNAWIQAYESGPGPVWAASDPVSQADKELHDGLCRTVDGWTRAQVARQLLVPEGGDFLNRVKQRHGVEVIGFAQDRVDLNPERPDELGPRIDAAANPPTGAAAAFTDLKLPLKRALELTGPGQSRILGVVVLTDGQHNWGEPPVAKALELGERQMPIFPVALGAKQPPPDVAIVSVKADPPQVFQGAEAPIEVVVQVSGLSPRDIAIRLDRAGAEPMEQTISHDGKTSIYRVHFRPKLDEVGTQVMTVSTKPLPEEIRSDNNRRQVSVRVASDKAKVLVIDQEMRWETHYLISALVRDPKMQVTSIVYDQPRLGTMSDDVLKSIGYPARALPEDPDFLSQFDCVILGDVPRQADVPAGADGQPRYRVPSAKQLDRYVRETGGTLVFLAGRRHMPQKYAAPAGSDPGADPLRALLPITEPKVVKPEDGFPLLLTAEGHEAGFLMMEDTSNKSDERWKVLPLHFWGVVGKVKPGAVPLAFVPPAKVEMPADPVARAAKQTELERNNALIAWQNAGLGRVLYVGLDSTWRFRYRAGDIYHHRFWGQVILWAATDRALPVGNDAVRFGTRKPVYPSGQEVEILARLGEGVHLGPTSLTGARIFKMEKGKETPAGLVTLERRSAAPRDLTGKLRDLPPGDYEIELLIPEIQGRLTVPGPYGQPKKLRARFSVTPPESEETVQLATNWPLLEELAAKSGGRVFTPEDASDLIDLLVSQAASKTLVLEHPLYRSWWTLGLFLVLVTAEWVLRKVAGLP